MLGDSLCLAFLSDAFHVACNCLYHSRNKGLENLGAFVNSLVANVCCTCRLGYLMNFRV